MGWFPKGPKHASHFNASSLHGCIFSILIKVGGVAKCYVAKVNTIVPSKPAIAFANREKPESADSNGGCRDIKQDDTQQSVLIPVSHHYIF